MLMDKCYGDIEKCALYSRVAVIILQYLSNILIPDHNAGVFLYPRQNINETVADKIVHHFLGGFLRWDAQYFIHIARHGYTYENTLAFFPLYPMMIRLLGTVIHLFLPFLSLDSILLLVFVLINMFLFILSAKTIFKLTKIFFDDTVAYKSTLLFCINPASIFFIAPYSECLFFFLTLQSILNCVNLYKKYSNLKCEIDYHDIFYLLPVCFSTVVRSNGIFNIGFVIYTYICINIKHWPKNNLSRKVIFIVYRLGLIVILTVICLVPFALYQIYCYLMFCTSFNTRLSLGVANYAKVNGFVLPGQFSQHNQSWCYNKVPLAYSYVQSHYWNVGFLKYYELKQIPNFLLAFPVLFIVFWKSFQYMRCNISKSIFDVFTFHLMDRKKKCIDIIHNPLLSAFVIHILCLSMLCLFFVHIQVSTRMICSASPVFYWFCADLLKDSKMDTSLLKYLLNYKISTRFIVVIYFFSYFFVGTIMFCNFLPWT